MTWRDALRFAGGYVCFLMVAIGSVTGVIVIVSAVDVYFQSPIGIVLAPPLAIVAIACIIKTWVWSTRP